MSKEQILVTKDRILIEVNSELSPSFLVKYRYKEKDKDVDFFNDVEIKKEKTTEYFYSIVNYNNEIIANHNQLKKADYPSFLHTVIIKTSSLLDGIYVDTGLELELDVSELAKVKKTIENGIKSETLLKGGTNLHDFIERYAFKKHILLMGERGQSKTYTVTKWAKDNKYHTEFIGGSKGLETIDLVGYYLRNDKGNFVFMNGKLAKAFKEAKDKKVVLIFDELLRVNQRELDILVSSLTINSDDMYVLNTNMIINEKDGQGETETIEIPKENLFVVATTNIGSDYDVENIDLALMDRFRTKYVKLEDKDVENIIKKYKGKFIFSQVNKIFTLYKKHNVMVERGIISHKMNLRHLCESLEIANGDELELKLCFIDLDEQLCGREDGTISEVEKKKYRELVKATL